MHKLINGTPLPLEAKAEGQHYHFAPFEIKEVHNDRHVTTLLENFHQRGLRAIQYGDDVEELKTSAMTTLTALVNKAIADEKAHNIEQAKQGLRPAPTNKRLQEITKQLQDSMGFAVVYSPGDDNPILATLAAASRQVKDMKPSGARDKLAAAIAVLTEHVEAEGTEPVTEPAPWEDEEIPNAAVKARANARRHAKQG